MGPQADRKLVRVGNRFRMWREALEMGQSVLALRMGCALGTVTDLEAGRNVGLHRVVAALKVIRDDAVERTKVYADEQSHRRRNSEFVMGDLGSLVDDLVKDAEFIGAPNPDDDYFFGLWYWTVGESEASLADKAKAPLGTSGGKPAHRSKRHITPEDIAELITPSPPPKTTTNDKSAKRRGKAKQ